MPRVGAARGGRQRLCSRPCCGGGSQLGTSRLVLSKRLLFSAYGFGKKNNGRAGQRHKTCPCCLWLGFRLLWAPPRLCSDPQSLSTQLQLSVRVVIPPHLPCFPLPCSSHSRKGLWQVRSTTSSRPGLHRDVFPKPWLLKP